MGRQGGTEQEMKTKRNIKTIIIRKEQNNKEASLGT